MPSPVTKAVPSCSAKAVSTSVGDPLVEIDDRVVEQRLRRRRHGVELHRRELQLGQRRRRRSAAAPPSPPTQPTAGPEIEKGFFSTADDTCRTEAMERIGDSTDSRRPISVSTSAGTR